MAGIATYPLITAKKLKESRDFYLRCFGMAVIFEASWVVMLSDRDDGTITLGLMSRDHPTNPPGPETFDGQGMILTIQVGDVAQLHGRLEGLGAPIVYPLTDEAWGQWRFMTRDPSGVLVDVVEQIAPASGYWDKYISSSGGT